MHIHSQILFQTVDNLYEKRIKGLILEAVSSEKEMTAGLLQMSPAAFYVKKSAAAGRGGVHI